MTHDTTRIPSIWAIALAGACLMFVATLASADGVPPPAQKTPDPVEGKWYGMAGFPQDRVPWGFEFQRDAKGTIAGFVYSPIINFYGLPLPGGLVRDGTRYVNKDWGVTLSFEGTHLQGTMFFNKVPMTLERAERLPSEGPIPNFDNGPGPNWQVKLGASIYARAAQYGATAYVGTTGGMFFAIDMKDGGYVWAFPAGRPILGEALATKENVYFVCDNGFLFKLDRKTGKEVWRYDLGDAQVPRMLPHQVVDNGGDFDWDYRASHPLLMDGVLYVGSGDGGMHAVDAANGKRVWRFETKGKVRGDAVADGANLIFGSFDGIVYAVDRGTGTEVWRKNTFAEITSSPALIGNTIVVGNRGGLLAGLDAAKGETIWKTQLWGSSVESTAVPAKDGLFYIGSSDLRRLSLMDAKDGRVVWRTDVYGWAWARPELSGKRVYMSATGADPYEMRHLGSLLALDGESGKILWRWQMPEWPGSWLNGFVASPAVAGEMVVVGGLDGSLYAFPA